MLEQLLQWDQELFVYLNSLGSTPYDFFWITVTTIQNWIPVFIIFFVIITLKYPKKEALFVVLTVVALAIFITQLTDVVKHAVERLRPNNTPEIKEYIRILKSPGSYSFFSGHSSSSSSIATLLYLFLRKRFKGALLFFIWPLLFAYSRIYVGVHYPLDIIIGAIVGVLSGFLFYALYKRFIALYLKLNHL
ncbi:phosphatase PAP2 family protein [uncultured Maribacter sp.]|uniref:phosphatase PAP2 family protein n=1 Tax=uncultured Maribacter sp. TaxID=431308 RepID=UPI002627D202|nr:phosphatase PAP2 family protein [uncultured Maribacter sp.]